MPEIERRTLVLESTLRRPSSRRDETGSRHPRDARAAVVDGMWHETIVFAKVLAATFAFLGVLALWQKLRS